MAKEELQLFESTTPSMAFSSPPDHPLSTVGILREAIKTQARDTKLTLHVMLLILSPLSLIFILHSIFARPLIEMIEHGSGDHHTSLFVLEIAFFVAFYIVTFFGMVISIHIYSPTYNIGRSTSSSSLRDLISWFCFSWRGPFITYLYVTFIAAISFVVIKLVINVITASMVVAILASMGSVYLASVLMLAIVVSVIEGGDCKGEEALKRAWKLMRGREVQGFEVMLILVLLFVPIFVVFIVAGIDDDMSLVNQSFCGIVAGIPFCLAELYIFVVMIVFYFECKKNHGERLELEVEDGFSLLSSS
ncbi:hypothetical protein HS088_TW12G00392 [Tripterygium wilfordii]|uniref:Transmembrane protein n=1 Tax=Tripterygium wilfordii TaxID=458696 RepID=A0A7J7CYL6_TRIWF|nr:uncharacterized protein LOC120010444 [Tripterygium wilfordii]KAF5739191.1 hypothetical protein HS088_TW12G00392 [Tripterygium wilfordii]